jgi:hypothetical protein
MCGEILLLAFQRPRKVGEVVVCARKGNPTMKEGLDLYMERRNEGTTAQE